MDLLNSLRKHIALDANGYSKQMFVVEIDVENDKTGKVQTKTFRVQASTEGEAIKVVRNRILQTSSFIPGQVKSSRQE